MGQSAGDNLTQVVDNQSDGRMGSKGAVLGKPVLEEELKVTTDPGIATEPQNEIPSGVKPVATAQPVSKTALTNS